VEEAMATMWKIFCLRDDSLTGVVHPWSLELHNIEMINGEVFYKAWCWKNHDAPHDECECGFWCLPLENRRRIGRITYGLQSSYLISVVEACGKTFDVDLYGTLCKRVELIRQVCGFLVLKKQNELRDIIVRNLMSKYRIPVVPVQSEHDIA
jgi:hypothetical protein